MSSDSRTEDGKALDVQSLSASMTVNNLGKSMEWYRDVLGFEIDERHERDGKLRAASLNAGSVRILLNQDDGAKGFDRIKGQGISLYLTTQQSVDDIADRAKSHGAALQSEPADMPWGMRIFTLHDPDGFKLVFARPIAP
jgi:PhnB protein